MINWKKYASLLLAGMLSLSVGAGTRNGAVCSVHASAVDSPKDTAQAAEGNTQLDEAGARANDSGQEMPLTGSDTDGSTGGEAQNGGAGENMQPDNGSTGGSVQDGGAEQETPLDASGENAQPEDTAGTQQPDDAGQAPQRPDVKADISETPTITADIVEDEQDDNVVITEQDKPYLALGANLNSEQRNTVLSLMGIDPASLDQYQVVTVTNEEEHQYLDAYLDASIIGTRALSSVVIVKRDKGDGIHISTKNISYCTVGMYKNALATAGLEDADVIIAGPFPLSGTAALIGAMKAYADMEEEEIDTESLDAAMNEIVVTGELNESLGDDVQTEEFIAYVKRKVVEGGLESKDKIQEVLSEACNKFEITLSDSEKERITSLMQKIGSLDLDMDSLLKQAGSIYDSLKEMESSSGILSRIAAFLKNLLEAVIQFFKGLFS